MNFLRIKKRKRYGVLALCLAALPLSAQQVYTLDECIGMALQNNARARNAELDLQSARHSRQSAFTQYFPSVSATGGGFLSSENILQLNLAPGMGMGMMKDGLVGGVTASLPLFTGGQIVNGNKLAKANVEKFRLLKQNSENEVRLAVEQHFWQVVMLKEKLKTLDALDTQLTRLTQDVQAAVDAGIANRNDLLQVRLKQNDVESSRISVQDGLNLSRRLLAQYIGAATDSIDVASHVGDSLPPSPAALYADPHQALALTPEYNLLQTQLKASKLQQKMVVGKQLPTVAIGGGYMYDNLLGFDQDFWLGFATVSIPLSGWWGGSVGIAARSIGQSAENLRLQTDYYAAGTCSMSDLLDAQTLYRQSRDRYVEAWAQYEIKKREYLQATGR